jgi:hypothetical protein
MKKAGLLFFSVLFFLASQTKAQSLHIGIKAGANLAEINGRSFNAGIQAGFVVGGYLEMAIDKKWGLQPELLYTQTRATTSQEFPYASNPQFDGIPGRTVTLNYINVPVLVTYKLLPVLSLQAGPSLGILLNTSQNIMTNYANAFTTTDLLAVFGAQVNLNKFKFGARYSYGLLDISKVTPSDTWTNQNIQLYMGFRIL